MIIDKNLLIVKKKNIELGLINNPSYCQIYHQDYYLCIYSNTCMHAMTKDEFHKDILYIIRYKFRDEPIYTNIFLLGKRNGRTLW